MPGERLRSHWPAILLAFWALWLSAEFFALGPSSYIRTIDNADLQLSARIGDFLAGQQRGAWGPQWMSGADRAAQGFVPGLTALPFRLFPGWLAYAIVMFAQRLVAAYFTYRLCRDPLQLGRPASLLAAFLYSMFSQVAINGAWEGFTLYDGLGLPGLPLVLWGLDRAGRCRTGMRLLVAAALGAFWALTASLPLTIFALPAIGFWFACVVPQRTVRFWTEVLVFCACWAGFSYPFILSVLAHAPLSHRVGWNLRAEVFGGWFQRLMITLWMLGDNWLGVLLLAAGLAFRHSARMVALAAATFFCLGATLLSTVLVRALPARFTHGFVIERFYEILPFFAAVGAAVALEALAERWEIVSPTKGRIALSGGLALLCMLLVVDSSIGVKWKALGELLDGSNYAAAYRHPAFKEVQGRPSQEGLFRVVTMSAGPGDPIHPAFAWAYGLETADGYLNMYSARYKRFWAKVIEPLMQRDPQRRAYFTEWGSRAYLFPPADGVSDGRPVLARAYYNLDLLCLANVRYLLSPLPLSDPELTEIGVFPNYSRSARLKGTKLEKLRQVLRGDPGAVPLHVYELRHTAPRFFLTSQVRLFDAEADLLDAIASAPIEELTHTAFVSRADLGNTIVPGGPLDPGSVRVVHYAPDEIIVEMNVPRTALLVASTSYDPAWKAAIDGTSSRIIPADHAFQGIAVPAGPHRVVLRYQP